MSNRKKSWRAGVYIFVGGCVVIGSIALVRMFAVRDNSGAMLVATRNKGMDDPMAPESRSRILGVEVRKVMPTRPNFTTHPSPVKEEVRGIDGFPDWRLAGISESNGMKRAAIIDLNTGRHFWVAEGEVIQGLQLVAVSFAESSVTFSKRDQTWVLKIEESNVPYSVALSIHQQPQQTPDSIARGVTYGIEDLSEYDFAYVAAGGAIGIVPEKTAEELANFLLTSEMVKAPLMGGTTMRASRVGGGELSEEQAAFVCNGGILSVAQLNPPEPRSYEAVSFPNTVGAEQKNAFVDDLGVQWMPFLEKGGVIAIEYK